jgi:hypothetical protein
MLGLDCLLTFQKYLYTETNDLGPDSVPRVYFGHFGPLSAQSEFLLNE